MSRTVVISVAAALIAALALALYLPMPKAKSHDHALKGYGIKPTGLIPSYPEGHACSPLTSLYASWIDVDGTRRDEIHSGVDGGRLGEPIYAPGPGIVKAVWRANWGWGSEGALLIRHSREALNMPEKGPPFYYTAYYHLDFDDMRHLRPGEAIARGQVLAHVSRPGGNGIYLPEVHWEVWEVRKDDKIEWNINKVGGKAWRNRTARLIDPLYMLAQEDGVDDDLKVAITPYQPGKDYSEFRGFTYILPCGPRMPHHATR